VTTPQGSVDELKLKLEKKKLLEKKLERIQGLPHLYGFKWYKWAREFFESRNHYNFLCAANQISKSSTQIRKAIHWATDKKLWKELWRADPLQFWYLYPNKDVATIEFQKKWIPQFLPKGKFKDDPVYGWKEEYNSKKIFALHFKSGVSIYFKTYGQEVQDLQTGTVDAIFCDEELPEELYSELNMRIAATDGYIHNVFTATIGQEYLRCTMEEKGRDELFKDAFKQQVSMFDCLTYEDGTPSHWTRERIQRVMNSCKSEAEVQRRVFGRFVVDGNLKYPSFTKTRNLLRDPDPPPEGWLIYSGVDIGSGGTDAHPSAIAFIAVRPDFRYGRVFRGWRGDGVVTTSGDVLTKYRELRAGLKMTAQYYDWQAKDFWTISSRVGETFLPAEKSHDIGEDVINVLFKNKMLDIDDVPELKALVTELITLKKTTEKRRAKDDFIDAMRYGITKIPWDFEAITGEVIRIEKERVLTEDQARRGQSLDDQLEVFAVEQELDEANELMES
jgi:phage terminase large subunit-like protein